MVVTQCNAGRVELGRYESSRKLFEAGAISGYDITTEAATAKMMILLGQELSHDEIRNLLGRSLKGEISID